MSNYTGYYATLHTPVSTQRIGAFYTTEVLTKHDSRDDAYAEARRVAATRSGTEGGVLHARHVED
jgi:hypothetical protein